MKRHLKAKPNFKHTAQKRHGERSKAETAGAFNADFWNEEYETQEHFALSHEPSEDLKKFVRYIDRNHGGMPRGWTVLDAGCGNGRNILWLAEEKGSYGVGYDSSKIAIAQATKKQKELFPSSTKPKIVFSVSPLESAIPLPDTSCDLVLDMMASHVLSEADRRTFVSEVLRVLKPGGWLFLKTFLRDEDVNAERMIKEHGIPDEPGSYMHPKLHIREHAFYEQELLEYYSEHFTIEKKLKSHAHFAHGKPNKRRFIVLYLVKSKG
jgi:SAM-dependent methyltransferase